MQKIIFAGTTEFGIPTLEKLKKDYELVLIITQPDKPTGRDKKLTPPPIKLWADKKNIQVLQPTEIRNSKFEIRNADPDLLLVAAYGQIIPKEILDMPKFGSINIHGSLLPKYRGASPIQNAILNGDAGTGITMIKMDEKMDHGQIIAMQSVALSGKETFVELYKTLAEVSSDLVAKTLPNWFEGKIKAQEQDHNQATYTKLLAREDAKIDWARPAAEIERHVRALNPEPGTWTQLSGKTIKILEVEVKNDHKIELPGKLYSFEGNVVVKTLDNGLILKKLKLEGKNEITGKDFLNGLKNLNDKIFI